MSDRIRLAGHWWIIRGRHGTGFHKFDAMNMTKEQALEEADRLLPTITDDQVTVMFDMVCGIPPVPETKKARVTVTINDREWEYDPDGAGDLYPWKSQDDRSSMPWPFEGRNFTADELQQVVDAIRRYEAQ